MLNQILKKLRKIKGITQEQLADVLNVERSSIGKYESPNKPVIPSSDVLIRMSDYFGVSLDQLLGKDDLSQQSSASDINLNEQEFALLCDIRELDEDGKEEIRRNIRMVKELQQLRRERDSK